MTARFRDMMQKLSQELRRRKPDPFSSLCLMGAVLQGNGVTLQGDLLVTQRAAAHVLGQVVDLRLKLTRDLHRKLTRLGTRLLPMGSALFQ
jgi:hypothetical protein